MKVTTRKIVSLLILVVLAGCQSMSKDEKYNQMTANQIYQQAVQRVDKKRYGQAIEDFEALEARYPFSDFADKAQMGAIYAHYLNEDYAQALPASERFIRMYPRHEHVDYAYYMKGLIHFSEALGFFSRYLPMDRAERDPLPAKKSLASFQHLITHYPQSAYAGNAKQRMVYLRNLLAEHELFVARFNLKKGAYLAAANRANYVVVHFDRAPQMEEALAIMVQAYRALERTDLARDAFVVLERNFPNSEFISQLA